MTPGLARTLVISLAFGLLAACGGRPAPTAPGRDELLARTWPCNVVVVLLDAARGDHFGYLGSDRPATPNIDALAARSVVFEQAYAQATGTANSVYSFFTSRYPVFESVPSLVGQNAIFLREDALTLMEAVSARHPHRLVLSTNPFVREYLGYAQGATEVIEDWRPSSGEKRGVPPRYAERVTGPGFSWIREHASEGLVAYLHYMEPHEPYQPPEPFVSKLARSAASPHYGRAAMLRKLGDRKPPSQLIDTVVDLYDANLAYVDSHVGALVDSLRAHDLHESTIIILISDHGEAFWEHGRRGHGHDPYEELIRVPFLVHLPSVPETHGVRVEEPVELVDLMPTILDLMGVPIETLDLVGRSLVDALLTGQTDPERLIHARSNRTERSSYALRKGRWKWMLRLETGEQELYDLIEDPGEQVDLVSAGTADAGLLEDFSDQLRIWLQNGRNESDMATPVDNMMMDDSVIESLKSLGYIE